MQPDFLKGLDGSVQDNALKIEALLFASEHALSAKYLRDTLNLDHDELEQALKLLQDKQSLSAIELVHTAAGLRMQVRAEFAALIAGVWPEREQKLSQAFLETLSIIAYKQPVTRADIEQIRGVSTASTILRQLFDKGWVREQGYRDLPGRPALLHTTKAFLDAFCLQHINELPELPELRDPSELES